MMAAILLAVRRLVFYVKQRFDCVDLFLSWKRFQREGHSSLDQRPMTPHKQRPILLTSVSHRGC